MEKFTHIDASTVEEAVSALGKYKGKAKVIAGGTDLLEVLKTEIHPEYPEAIVNIKTIPNMGYIKEEAGALKIGALTTLSEIAESSLVKGKYAALAQATDAVGSPLLRNMGTIGGNLCQENRCWYYRARKNYFNCLRKNPAGLCYALIGDNRYHSIFGALNGCIAVNPSDTAPALVALDASVVTSKRTIAIKDLFTVDGEKTTVLDDDEIVTEVQVPEPKAGTKQVFLKFRIRKTIDFAISSVATAITIEAGTVADARIVLGAVAPVPYRSTGAEDTIKGKAISESVADEAGTAAVKGAMPFTHNAYLVPITKALVKRAILA